MWLEQEQFFSLYLFGGSLLVVKLFNHRFGVVVHTSPAYAIEYWCLLAKGYKQLV